MNAIAPEFGDTGRGLGFEAAWRRVLALVTATLAVDVIAVLDLPRFYQSVMDGCAVRAADIALGALFPFTGRTAVGEVRGRLVPESVHRILTDAPLDARADTVIAQEREQLSAMQRGRMAWSLRWRRRREGVTTCPNP